MNEPTAWATLLVMGVTFIFSYRGLESRDLLNRLMFSTTSILRDKQYRRLITSGLIHADWPHFLFNMFSLYSFGKYIELSYGAPTLLLIYLTSIVGGNLLSLYLHRHHEYRALGASGGVCGVIFAAIFLLPGGGVRLFLVPIAIPTWAFAILFILGSFYGLRAGRDNIGHDAHLGGALVGLAVTTVLYPDIIILQPAMYLSVTLLSGALLAYTFKFPPSLYPVTPYGRDYWKKSWSDLKTAMTTRGQLSDQERLDILLEKISKGGLGSLTPHEQNELKEISRKKNEFKGKA